MIITVSGAGCTGKTTLLNKVHQTLAHNVNDRKIHCYGEFIRNFFDIKYSSKYKTYEDLLEGDLIDIIDIHKDTARYFNEVLWSSDLNDILIFDRSPLDIAIYLYMNSSRYLNVDKDRGLLQKYREASRYIYRCSESFMKNNPIILYARPFTDIIEDDGFRPVSLTSRRDLEISLFDKEFLSLPDVHILPNSLEDRVSMIESLISLNVK